MQNRITAAFAASVLLCLIPAAGLAQLTSYSQDFETLIQSDPSALAADGWLVFGNVYSSSGCVYAYGAFPAPNDPNTPAFSLIASGQGGLPQGAQQLVVISDYNNFDHANPALTIESNVYQEQVIGAADVGKTGMFRFDAKLGDIQPPSTAVAFIKTVDLSSYTGCAPDLSNFIMLDMTSIPTTWGTYSLSIVIDAGLVGQLLQFGFLNVATNFAPTDIFYDNVSFDVQAPLPTTTSTWGGVKSLYR